MVFILSDSRSVGLILARVLRRGGGRVSLRIWLANQELPRNSESMRWWMRRRHLRATRGLERRLIDLSNL